MTLQHNVINIKKHTTFLIGYGSRDTKKNSLDDYDGVTIHQIRNMVEEPQARDKSDAAFILPSTYKKHDARTHDVQRKYGEFHMLAVDIDTGNKSMTDVQGAIEAIIGDRAMLIYSTSSSTPEERKWRVLIPLADMVLGELYSDFQVALFDLLRDEGIDADYTLSRCGQPVFLPNVPRDKRDESGKPLFYQYSVVRAQALRIDDDHPIAQRMFYNDAQRKAIEAQLDLDRKERQAERERKRKESPDALMPIDEFNARHTVEDLLFKYGYTRLGSSKSYKSPYQSTGSFATKDFGDYWVSLSGSDLAAGVGNEKGNGAAAYCWGDAFTLYCHYEHDGDVEKAVRAYGQEINPKPVTQSVEDVWSKFKDDFEQAKSAFVEPEAQPIANEFVDDADTGDTPAIKASAVDLAQLQTIPPRRWAYGTKLVRGFISILAAPAGVGKSAWSATMALDLASGKTTMHDAPRGKQKVWLVNLEDPRDETLRKIAAAMKHEGKAYPEDCLQNLFVDSGRDQNFIVAEEPQQGVMIATPQYEQLVMEIKRRGIDVLVLDPFVRAHHVNENANKSIDYVMDLFAKIADKCDISVLLVHHTRKGFVGGDADSVRGSSSMVGAARVAFTLSPMSSEEASAFNISQDDRRSYIRLDNAKANLSKSAGDAQWIFLDSVNLGNASEEYPNGDSVQVATPWSPPDAWDGIDTEKANEILTLIEDGYIDEDGNKEPYGETKQSKDRWVGHLIIACTMDADGSATKSEDDAKKIIKTWINEGILANEEFETKNRKTAKGLVVKSKTGKQHD